MVSGSSAHPVLLPRNSVGRHRLRSALGAGRADSVSWRIAWERDWEVLWLRWSEAGRPPLVRVPTRRGFGFRVIESTIRNNSAARCVRAAWEPGELSAAQEKLV
jgi:hypothetical protein